MLEKQCHMVFGRRGVATTDVEVDETCLQSWTTKEPTPEGAEETKHYFFVVLGIRQRGDLSKLWLRFVVQGKDLDLHVGITRCVGENKRVPPVSTDFWLRCASDAFHEDSNVILHTDQAQAYENCTPKAVVRSSHGLCPSRKQLALRKRVLALLAPCGLTGRGER